MSKQNGPAILFLAALAACSSAERGAGVDAESGGSRSDAGDAMISEDAAGAPVFPDGPTDVARASDTNRDESSSDVRGDGPGMETATTSCPASAAGNTPLGSDTPPAASRWKVTDAITFLNVGGTGGYDRVVDMAAGTWPPPCADPNACVKATKSISGPLVPFDEEMTMVFSGPIELYDLAVYSPGNSAPGNAGFARVSSWDRCTSDNLVFMNNLGGGSVSGVWTVCGGNSQSYASADGSQAVSAPTQFAGTLADGVGVNVMSAKSCQGTGDGSECGFYREVGMHGWKGAADGTKIFAVKMRMPVGAKTPAYWILPAQVVRTAQYGCNCRGMGGAGGCGELDVAEVLSSEDPMAATSTIYSFKSVKNGGGSTFQRPAMASAIFVVIFDGAAGTISLRRLEAEAFDFGPSIDSAVVAAWQANQGATSSM